MEKNIETASTFKVQPPSPPVFWVSWTSYGKWDGQQTGSCDHAVID